VKDQLTRLSAADFRIGTVIGEGRAVTLKGSVIEGFDLWTSRDPQQRALWPTTPAKSFLPSGRLDFR
jgi:hypothetical protein